MPTKPFLDVPGYTGTGLKGGSTVLKKSREQRRNTFTPNKRDPSEFITVPNAGATRLNIKPKNPPTTNVEGFTKNPAVLCPLLRAAPPKGGQPQHKAQQGLHTILAKGIAYHKFPSRTKGEKRQSWAALARGAPTGLGGFGNAAFCERKADIPPLRGRSSGGGGCGTLRLNGPGPVWGAEAASLRPGSAQTAQGPS